MMVPNKYRLGRRIGSGWFGEIYLGTSTQTNEEVAIKLFTEFVVANWVCEFGVEAMAVEEENGVLNRDDEDVFIDNKAALVVISSLRRGNEQVRDC
ncbi:hypothetical protein Droror1_Dr00017472 [Drosera rotundifolia]